MVQWIFQEDNLCRILIIITPINNTINFIMKYLQEINLIINKFFNFKEKNNSLLKKLEFSNKQC